MKRGSRLGRWSKRGDEGKSKKENRGGVHQGWGFGKRNCGLGSVKRKQGEKKSQRGGNGGEGVVSR